MDYATTFAISAAGMNLERTRVEIAALNLANANTVQTPSGPNYHPLHVVAKPSTSIQISFDDLMNQGMASLSVPAISIEPTGAQPRMVYMPNHPLANDKGFVAYAGVDNATEMMTLMGATHAYEANVAAMNTARTLALKALEIGGSNG